MYQATNNSHGSTVSDDEIGALIQKLIRTSSTVSRDFTMTHVRIALPKTQLSNEDFLAWRPIAR